MKLETFFDNFELLADAPNGVQKLRELILQLAMRGKLVPQDANDEPASIMIKKIKAERERLIKEKKIKKTEPIPIKSDDIPYDLPENWEWTCLYQIGEINPRNDADDTQEVSFVPMSLISATYGEPIKSEIRRWGEVKKGFTHFAEEDVVLAKITPCFQNGKSVVMRRLINGLGAGTTELHVFRRINNLVCPDYVLIYLKSPMFITKGISKMTGSAGQKRVPNDYFSTNPFPLPPLEEQHRIVAKIDQLMSLCDELEARQQKKRESRAHLNSAALDRLLAARAPGEFEQSWQCICDNFDLLYDTPENVDMLRKIIIQLAVMGKLAQQDSNDEPASILLEKIRAEKERLIREKRIRREEPLIPIESEGASFKIPEGWIRIRLGDVINCLDYLRMPVNKGERQIRSGNIPYYGANGQVGWINDFLFDEDLVLVVEDETFIGRQKPFCYKISGKSWVNNHAHVLQPTSGIDVDFLNYSLAYYPFAALTSGTTGRKKLTKTGLLNVPYLLPPLAEQHRIIAKIGQLLSLCNALEAGLARSRADGEKLMETVVGWAGGGSMDI